MLLEQRFNMRHHLHQNNVKNGEDFEWVPNHLGIEIRIIIEHITGVNIKRVSVHFKHSLDSLNVLPIKVKLAFGRGLARPLIPKVLEEPNNSRLDIVDTNVGPPDISGTVFVHVETLAALG